MVVSRRIAVVGASGFVGRHFVRHAISAGWDVIGAVRSDAAARVVSASGGRPALASALDADVLAPAFAECAAVVHLAMIGSEHPGETYESVNIRGTEEVVSAAGRAGVPRVVLFSGLGVARYGQSPRSTNPYFLSKLAAEVALYRSGREAVVFRPSYVIGSGDPFVPRLVGQMAKGEVEQPGDGSYRLQPISVDDAAASILAAVEQPPLARPVAFDLVGPEPIRFDRFLERLGAIARAATKAGAFRVRVVGIADADARARAGGFLGMRPDALDCLLCDEVADPAPLVALLGRPLAPLDAALRAALPAS
jgi:nucleoside-diphosphate-sugar epimerase